MVDNPIVRPQPGDGMDSVHCLTPGHDGLVYACNRQHSRIQVYDKMGVLRRAIPHHRQIATESMSALSRRKQGFESPRERQ
jgi:hypothetical protein